MKRINNDKDVTYFKKSEEWQRRSVEIKGTRLMLVGFHKHRQG